jgi:hypothetical protein
MSKLNPRYEGLRNANGFVSPRFFGRICRKHPQAHGERYRSSGACIICARVSSARSQRRRGRLPMPKARPSPKLDAAKEFLKEFLADGPRSVKEIRQAAAAYSSSRDEAWASRT